MGKLKVFWYYEPNFGDAIAPYLIRKLSGKEVVYTPSAHRISLGREWRRFKVAPHEYDWHRISWPETRRDVIMSVGSILENSRPNYHVWGTGLMNANGVCKGGHIHAVRGRLTAERLVKLGFPQCDVVGDPALLLPVVYNQPYTDVQGSLHIPHSTNKLGIVPHIIEYESCKREYADEHVISLHTCDVERVVDKICSCGLILSSSLHGIIVAHAYGIPALWVKARLDVGGGDFKYRDYLSSVGKDTDFITYEELKVMLKFDRDALWNRAIQLLPNREVIKGLQEHLLSVCPFPVLEKWKGSLL